MAWKTSKQITVTFSETGTKALLALRDHFNREEGQERARMFSCTEVAEKAVRELCRSLVAPVSLTDQDARRISK